MTAIPNRSSTHIRAVERGQCDIPLSILGSGIRQEAFRLSSLSGLVEFRYAGPNVRLIIGGVVGHLSLTPDVILLIEPKFPIRNMSRMVWRSRESIAQATQLDRFYEIEKNQIYTLEVMIRMLAKALEVLLVEGVHRQYERRENRSIPRPHINFRRTEQLFWSRGIFSSASITEFILTNNILLNSLIKAALRVGLRHARQNSELTNEARVLGMAAETFRNVSELRELPSDAEVRRALESIPSFRKAYYQTIPLALELVRGSSILLDRYGSGVTSSSFLVNLEDVFEAFVRNVLHETFHAEGTGLAVLDGNKKQWAQPLMNETDKYVIKPDLIFRIGNEVKLIGDAKYKQKSKEEDRYQILTHALSMRCKNAVLVYPASEKISSGLKRIGSVGPSEFQVTLFEYGLPLDGELQEAELEMCRALAGTCGIELGVSKRAA